MLLYPLPLLLSIEIRISISLSTLMIVPTTMRCSQSNPSSLHSRREINFSHLSLTPGETPSPPPLLPPQPFLNDGHVHYMQGVNDSDPFADLTPSQLGVLLTFEPANSGFIMDKVVLHNMRKALLHCLQKMNNSSADSLVNKRFSNLFTVLPFLFLQTGSFDKNQLRERSEKFKNLIN